MKLRNINEVQMLLQTVDSCDGDVWIESVYGDRYNLKSKLSQYVAIGKILSESGDELDLYCQLKSDESKFFDLFNKLGHTM